MRADEALKIITRAEVIFAVDHAVEFDEGGVLVKAARERPGGGIECRLESWIVVEESHRVGLETDQPRRVVDRDGLVAHLAFVVGKVEEFVAAQRAADGAAKLLPPVRRLRNAVDVVDGVVGIECGVQNVVVGVAMHLVAAAASDRVDQAPAGLAELGFKTGAGHLKFLDHVFAELKWNRPASNLLGEKSVVVVGAVHRVIVEVAGDAVEADHPKIAVRGRSRREQDKVGEIAAVQRQRINALLTHHCPQRRCGGIHERNRRGDGQSSFHRLDRQLRTNVGRGAHIDDDLGRGKLKARFFDGNPIGARRQIKKNKESVAVRRLCRCNSCGLVARRHRGARHNRFRGIQHGAFQAAAVGARLRMEHSRQQEEGQCATSQRTSQRSQSL